MTIPACSIEKSASTMVDIFGLAAPAIARERMTEYPPGNHKEGYRFWLAVAHAAADLLDRERASKPVSGEKIKPGAGAFSTWVDSLRHGVFEKIQQPPGFLRD